MSRAHALCTCWRGASCSGRTRRGTEDIINPAFIALLEFEMARAEDYYRSGMRGIRLLDDDARLAIALSATLYRAVLHRIRRNGYDVFTRRAHIWLPGKIAALPAVWLRTRNANASE